MSARELYGKWNSVNLMLRIVIGLVLGIVLAILWPGNFLLCLIGDVFVGALKAIAPFLVFFLVVGALSKSREKLGPQFRTIIILYIAGMIIAAVLATAFNFIHPVKVHLETAGIDPAVDSFDELISNVIMNLVDNPLSAMITGNYLGVLFWGIVFGILLKRYANSVTLDIAADISSILTKVIRLIINFAPFGIFGLVYDSISSTSLEEFAGYGAIVVILVSAMLIVMFVTNPILFYLTAHRNPYPILIKCLRTSAVTAFFTRSSAANIPVNLQLAKDFGLDEDFYSVSIPLGATINMSGAAVTVSTLALVTAFSYGVTVSIPMAIVLCIVSAIAACGSSGVAGGSLLLVPTACSLFGIPDEIAMQVVAIGFIISVIQDSMETALNSSTDVYFTAAADIREHPDLKINE